MGKVYICADANLLTDEKITQKVIKNWRQVIKPDDIALIIGNFVNKEAGEDKIKEVISQLTGTLEIIDYGEDLPSGFFSKEKWLNFGISRTICVGGYTIGEICGEEQPTIIAVEPRNFGSHEVKYYAAAQSLSKKKERFKDNTLNLSMEHWNYTPILYTDISRMIDDAILFESMNNEEINLSEK